MSKPRSVRTGAGRSRSPARLASPRVLALAVGLAAVALLALWWAAGADEPGVATESEATRGAAGAPPSRSAGRPPASDAAARSGAAAQWPEAPDDRRRSATRGTRDAPGGARAARPGESARGAPGTIRAPSSGSAEAPTEAPDTGRALAEDGAATGDTGRIARTLEALRSELEGDAGEAADESAAAPDSDPGLAGAILEAGHPDAPAEALLWRALNRGQEVWGPDSPQVAQALTRLSDFYRTRAYYQEAEQLLERALPIHASHEGQDAASVGLDLGKLGLLALAQGDFERARVHYEDALAIELKRPWSVNPQVSYGLNELAIHAQRAGRPADAERIYRWALDLNRDLLGSQHSGTSVVRTQYAQFLRAAGREEEARQLLEE